MKGLDRYACLFAVLGSVFVLSSRASDEHLCFDASSAAEIREPMRLATGSGEDVAKGAYLEIPRNEQTANPEYAGKAMAEYRFATRGEGVYILWCRVWWEDECANSFRISLNGQPPFVLGRNRNFRRWHWVRSPARLKQLQLAEGEQILQVLHRETGVKIDQILLTTDSRYVPFGIEEETAP